MNVKKPQEPHEIIKYFFQSLRQQQLTVCWGIFSNKTQQHFLQWALKDMYEQHGEAARAAKLGTPEIKLMFESNNMDLLGSFWRRFVRQSQAVKFAHYGWFHTVQTSGRKATVEARMLYENGQEEKVALTMLHERGAWRFGYLESGLPF